MRFLSDDAHFGFRMAPTTMRKFYRFQLIFDDQLVGDEEPCIAGSCFGELSSISTLQDSRLQDGTVSESEADDIISSDDELSDAALKNLTESLDGWITRIYAIGDRIYIGVRNYLTGVILRASLPYHEFNELVATMHFYWTTQEESA